MSLIKIEIYKKRYIIFSLIGIELALDALAAIGIIHIENGVDTIYSFWQMISWLFIVGYCIWDFYSYFYLCRDRMLLLSLKSKGKVLLEKSIVYFVLMMLYFSAGLVRYIVTVGDGQGSKIQIFCVYFISKAIALVAFLSVLILFLCIFKHIDDKFLSFALMLISGGIIIGIQAYLLYTHISSDYDITWIIGVVDGKRGIYNYANILPIAFIDETNRDIPIINSYYPISSIWNAVEAFISTLASYIILHFTKYDYVEK